MSKHKSIIELQIDSRDAWLYQQPTAFYQTDEWMMHYHKVLPCPQRAPHSWPECPFTHNGERARRRDLRKCKYSSDLCPEANKGRVCPKGDECPKSHNVFESWLHPELYRTQMCAAGARCNRRVCFFAHIPQQLRTTSKVLSTAAYTSFKTAATAAPASQPLEQQEQEQQQQQLLRAASASLADILRASPGPLPQELFQGAQQLSLNRMACGTPPSTFNGLASSSNDAAAGGVQKSLKTLGPSGQQLAAQLANLGLGCAPTATASGCSMLAQGTSSNALAPGSNPFSPWGPEVSSLLAAMHPAVAAAAGSPGSAAAAAANDMGQAADAAVSNAANWLAMAASTAAAAGGSGSSPALSGRTSSLGVASELAAKQQEQACPMTFSSPQRQLSTDWASSSYLQQQAALAHQGSGFGSFAAMHAEGRQYSAGFSPASAAATQLTALQAAASLAMTSQMPAMPHTDSFIGLDLQQLALLYQQQLLQQEPLLTPECQGFQSSTLGLFSQQLQLQQRPAGAHGSSPFARQAQQQGNMQQQQQLMQQLQQQIQAMQQQQSARSDSLGMHSFCPSRSGSSSIDNSSQSQVLQRGRSGAAAVAAALGSFGATDAEEDAGLLHSGACQQQ